MNYPNGTHLRPGHIAMLLDSEHFKQQTGVALRAISIILKADGWQIVFRGTRHSGAKVYCLWMTRDLADGLGLFLDALRGKEGGRYWYPDKFTGH